METALQKTSVNPLILDANIAARGRRHFPLSLLEKNRDAAIFEDWLSGVFTLPIRYDDRRTTHSIGSFSQGDDVYLSGRIVRIEEKPGAKRSITEAFCEDANGQSFSATFFQFTAYHRRLLSVGFNGVFHGKAKLWRDRWTVTQPEILAYRDMGKIVPIYRRMGKIGTDQIRSTILSILQAMGAEGLRNACPNRIHRLLAACALPDIVEAVRHVHFPRGLEEISDGIDAMKVAEIGWLLEDMNQEVARQQVNVAAASVRVSHELSRSLSSAFPFALSPSQQEAWQAIQIAIEGTQPARMLLLGGVGSGKSAIAYLAALAQVLAGDVRRLALIVAPTTILADQLYDKLLPLAERFQVPVLRAQSKARKNHWPESGIVVATHAYPKDTELWDRVGIAIFDEEHRYGSETKEIPASVHRLFMSATPIPATLAQTRFGGMQILRLQSNPMGRQVECRAISRNQANETLMNVQHTLDAGGKAIVVYHAIDREKPPVIEPAAWIQSHRMGTDQVVLVEHQKSAAEALRTALKAPESAPRTFYRLNKQFSARKIMDAANQDLFGYPVLLYDKDQPDRLFQAERHHLVNAKGEHRRLKSVLDLCRNGLMASMQLLRESEIVQGKNLSEAAPIWEKSFIGKTQILHGKLSEPEKSAILAAFASGEKPILLSTSIVEVGVDIDGVDTIIVGNADRMGVASLVQLRGRVGRRGKPGLCCFIGSGDTDSMDRLERIAAEKDDEKLAAMDFLERGFGALLGKKQSGHKSRIFRLPRDGDLLQDILEKNRELDGIKMIPESAILKGLA